MINNARNEKRRLCSHDNGSATDASSARVAKECSKEEPLQATIISNKTTLPPMKALAAGIAWGNMI
jgi:hypothetical protein